MAKKNRVAFLALLVIISCIVTRQSDCLTQDISLKDIDWIRCKGITGSSRHMIWLFESEIPVTLLYSYDIEGYRRYEWNEFEIGDKIYLLVDLAVENEELALYVLTISGDQGNNIKTTRFFSDAKNVNKGMTRYSGKIQFSEETKITTWEVENKAGEKYRLNFYVKIVPKKAK